MNGNFKPYILGIYEKAMPEEWSWPDKMEKAGMYGFDYIEMSIDETDKRQERLNWSHKERRDFAMKAFSCLPVSSICLSAHRKYTIGSHFPEIRKKGMEIMEKAIEFAYDTGVRIIQLAGYDVYYNEVSDAETKKYFAENLAVSAAMASSRGVMLGLETMENDFMNTTEKAMEYVRLIDSPYLGVYPDTGNISNAVKNAAEDLYTGHGHIFAAHLKETKTGIYRNLMYGDGNVNFALITDALFNMDVRRCTAEFWHLPGRDAEEDLKYANGFLKALLNESSAKYIKTRKAESVC